MGFRFRKSINLGGGFKVNLSKSGVGYSWGTKGVRFTKTAKGTKRTTLSVPGTGLSYVSESSGKKKAKNCTSISGKTTPQPTNNHTNNSPNRQDNQEGTKSNIKKQGNSIKKILLWILTVFFVIFAFAYLPALTGFISLLVAVLLAPIQKWQNLIGKFIKGRIKTIAIIVLVILTFASAPTTETSDNDIPPKTTMSVVDETTEATQGTTTEPTTESTTEPTTAPTTEPTTEPTTAPTTEPTTAPTEYNGRDYVLNTSTMKFHYPGCSSADDIKDANKAYFHGTRDELIAKGYSPCGKCHP